MPFTFFKNHSNALTLSIISSMVTFCISPAVAFYWKGIKFLYFASFRTQARWHFWLMKGKTCFFLFFFNAIVYRNRRSDRWSYNCVRGVWHVSRYISTRFTIFSGLVFIAISLVFRDISIIITQYQETRFCLTTGCKWELIARIICSPLTGLTSLS